MDEIISFLTILGIGSILGAFAQYHFQHQKDMLNDIHALKRKRYGAILIQMLTVLDPQKGLIRAQSIRPDLKCIDDFIE